MKHSLSSWATALLLQVDGINSCVLAYGQTGAGKSFTMGTDFSQAEAASSGTWSLDRDWLPLSQQAVEAVMQRVKAAKQAGTDIQVSCSFMEIYQDRIRDLLAATPASSGEQHTSSVGARRLPRHNDTPRQVQLRDPDPKKEVILVGLEEVEVTRAQEVMARPLYTWDAACIWVNATGSHILCCTCSYVHARRARYAGLCANQRCLLPAAPLQLHQCLLDGVRVRATAATNANLHSSRSHAIFVIKVRQVMCPVMCGCPQTAATQVLGCRASFFPPSWCVCMRDNFPDGCRDGAHTKNAPTHSAGAQGQRATWHVLTQPGRQQDGNTTFYFQLPRQALLPAHTRVWLRQPAG